ncbi:hypothetical protein DAI22_07g173550 [Oryza sativa Japonica Group]|nr:hypothetical protein DAI22_07g173550 [Oryza sativa Japonica Group]
MRDAHCPSLALSLSSAPKNFPIRSLSHPCSARAAAHAGSASADLTRRCHHSCPHPPPPPPNSSAAPVQDLAGDGRRRLRHEGLHVAGRFTFPRRRERRIQEASASSLMAAHGHCLVCVCAMRVASSVLVRKIG